MNISVYLYPNYPCNEDEDDEPEEEDLMVICSRQYDEIIQALKQWYAYSIWRNTGQFMHQK